VIVYPAGVTCDVTHLNPVRVSDTHAALTRVKRVSCRLSVTFVLTLPLNTGLHATEYIGQRFSNCGAPSRGALFAL
jgi:hypothetical protein